MKNILVIGASGMAGHVIYTHLKEIGLYNVIGTTNKNSFEDVSVRLDIFDTPKLAEVIQKFKPDYVINCVGMLIKGAKMYPDTTVYANAYFPHLLSRLSLENEFKLIHISTDCVFSGKSGAYTEFAFKDAVDLYGMSKSLGEIVDDRNLTIRTSIIGPDIKEDGEGLFNWFMSQSGTISGFKSNFWSGVTTLELAKFVSWIIDNDKVGLINLTNNIPISKFNLVTLFNNVYNKGLIINDDKDYKCDKSLISMLSQNEYEVPSYEEMLFQQKNFMDLHSDFYKHY